MSRKKQKEKRTQLLEVPYSPERGNIEMSPESDKNGSDFHLLSILFHKSPNE